MCQHRVVRANDTERSMWYTCIWCGSCVDSVVVGSLKRIGELEIHADDQETKMGMGQVRIQTG